MNKKLFFEIDEHEILENPLDSHFATARILAFSSGKNRHGYFCSEETLRNTSQTLDYKPIVYLIDELFLDFGTHSKIPEKSLIAGFVIPNSQEFKTLPDGRLGLYVNAKIWKKYSGRFMNFMKRDGGKKSVSVEMDLYESSPSLQYPNIEDMNDFEYNAICILGDNVTPASPDASIEMISFAEEQKEYEKLYRIEFGKYEGLDFTIPKKVKENAKNGLELRKKYGRGSTGVGVSTAKYLISNQKASPEKVRHISKYFPRHENDNLDDKTSNGWISWCLREDSEIAMADGTFKTIGEICKKKINSDVLTYNEKTGDVEPKKIKNWFINPSNKDEFIQMGSSVGHKMGLNKKNSLFLTKDHMVYTNHGWIKAEDVSGKKYNYLDYVPNNYMEEVINGIVLGDASLTKDGRISFSHCKKQELYGDEISKILNSLVFSKKEILNSYGKNGKKNVSFQYRSNSFSFFEEKRLDMYSSGKKEVSKDFLSKLTPISIAFWVMDDGSLHFDKRENSVEAYSYRLHIEGFSDVSAQNIHDYFENLDMKNSVLQRENTSGKVIYFSRDGSKKLANIIAPYVHESMRYKLPENLRDVPYEIDYSKFYLNLGIFEKDVMVLDNGSDIRDRHRIKPEMCNLKYDIEVEDNHNFFANGILVHNCIWGGSAGRSWSTKLVKEMDKIDSSNMSFFSEGVGVEKEENLEMKNEKPEEEKMEEEVAIENAAPESEEEKKESDFAEESDGDKSEGNGENTDESEDEKEEESEEENMSLDAYADVPAMLSLLESETEDYREMSRKFNEEKSVDWQVFAKALFEKAKNIKEEAEGKEKAYMSENEELKKFKSDIEEKQYSFEVGKIFAQVQSILPKDKFEEVKEDAKNFSLESLDAFKNKTLALAFQYSKTEKKNEKDSEFVAYQFPVSGETKHESPWG